MTDEHLSATTDRLIFERQYGKGSQTGYLNQDVVSLGGYTVNNTVFAAANSLNQAFTYYPISVLFGLGFGTISASGCVVLADLPFCVKKSLRELTSRKQICAMV